MKDTEFHDLLDRSTRRLDADVDRLVAVGVARGRTSLRRRRFGTAIAAVGVTAAVTVGVAVAPNWSDDDPAPTTVAQIDPGFAAAPVPADELLPQPERPDRPITVPARLVPDQVADLLGTPGAATAPLERAPYILVDSKRERIVHFRWQGTLTTVTIDAAHSLASCEELALGRVEGLQLVNPDGGELPTPPTREPNECRVVDGLQVLVIPAYDLPAKAQGATAWNHGYAVSVTSYNVPDGKNPDGSEDVTPLMDHPAVSMDALIDLATSEIWFE